MLKILLAATVALASPPAASAQVSTGHYDVTDAVLSGRDYDRLEKDITADVHGRTVTRIALHTTDGAASWRSGDVVPKMASVTYTADGKSRTDTAEAFVGVVIEIAGDTMVKLTDTRQAEAVIAEAKLAEGPVGVRRLYVTRDEAGRLERHLLTVRRAG